MSFMAQVERMEKEYEEADEKARKLEEEARQARCAIMHVISTLISS